MKNNSSFPIFALIILGIIGVIGFQSAFIVHQTEYALVMRLGKYQKTLRNPGLHFKVPFIENVEFLDSRVLDVDLPEQTMLSLDRQNLVVDAFLRYRISDPLRYYQKTGNNTMTTTQLLTNFVNAATTNVLAHSPREAIIRTGRGQLMEQIQDRVKPEAEDLGVSIIDLRLTRVNLPEKNLKEVYKRMREEREKEAAEIEGKGRQKSVEIIAMAQRDAQIIVAEAERKAEEMRGQGDAEHSRILAEVGAQDPDFYNFFRSLQAYENGLSGNSTNWVINPNSDFFSYLQGKDGKK